MVALRPSELLSDVFTLAAVTRDICPHGQSQPERLTLWIPADWQEQVEHLLQQQQRELATADSKEHRPKRKISVDTPLGVGHVSSMDMQQEEPVLAPAAIVRSPSSAFQAVSPTALQSLERLKDGQPEGHRVAST